MCGIVGYVGPQNAAEIIFNGLKRLEYRGYDSAGIAVIDGDCISLRRDVGKLSNLAARLETHPIAGNTGMGHTRWATHGKPSERNAHPHADTSGEVVVVQNGIVENFRQLKAELEAEGIEFKSETDTEVIAHLVSLNYSGGRTLVEAVRAAMKQLRGPSAVVVLSNREPGLLVAARLGNAGGVAIGFGEGEMFIASDMPAILEHTRRMAFLENGQMAEVTARRRSLLHARRHVLRAAHPHDLLGPHLRCQGRVQALHAEGDLRAGDLPHRYDPGPGGSQQRRRVPGGGDHHPRAGAGVRPDHYCRLRHVGIRRAGRAVPFRGARAAAGAVEYGSEFRYRDPVVTERTLMVGITQSGETVDTLAALDEGRGKGAHLASIVNVIGSQAARISDSVIYMHSGPEIGVASTKAFTASIVCQYLLAVQLGALRGTLSVDRRRQLLDDLAALPALAGRVLGTEHTPMYEQLAQEFSGCRDFLFLGRGINYPIALEGALKLKEISYIHAEGYPAGEMKHGPIALIDEEMPVVAICPQGPVYDKMVSQVEQVKARGGIVIAVATEGDDYIATKADRVIYVPAAPELLTPVLTVIPLQLLAYYIAVRRGADVDQPRNLAKSVTVE